MEGKLTGLTTQKLLEKFGAGNHKPGSGSASALQGMLSAQLLRTVIELTCDPKRKKSYSGHVAQLINMKKEIEGRIFPTLDKLFQEDSEQFDKVIQLREQRDAQTDLSQRRLLEQQHLDALKLATEIPLQIAELCLELVNFAGLVFDKGFKSARGDSSVALNSAISGVAGCLAIAELNLTSFSIDDWTEEIRQHKRNLKSRYDKVRSTGDEKLAILEKESEENMIFNDTIAYFQKGNLADSIRSNLEIEDIVRRLQNTLWIYREKIWKHDTPDHPLLVLKAEVALKKIVKYDYQESDSLGINTMDGDWFEIAGLIDKRKRLVQVSKKFPRESQSFTMAHELGHAILHKQLVLHRDKSIDGSTTPKSMEEVQANKFAAYFLMPANLVQSAFTEIFEMSKFSINVDTVLALNERNISAFRQKCRNRRGLARRLASAEYFKGKPVNSLAKIFGVTVETMAIRLEELDLFEF